VSAAPGAPRNDGRRPDRSPSSGNAAILVAAGILVSRLLGLVRQRAIAHFLGVSAATDAFTAAVRVPNLLQNLLGEGVLSASFIPVYAGLRARGDDAGRRELASGVLALLAAVTAVLVLAGVLAAPLLAAIVGPGFAPETRALTTRIIRVLFPGAALFVISAWCLGVLNSHGRFFLSYVSAAFWNVAMIATLLFFGSRADDASLVVLLAWGSVAGSLLQLAVQLPTTRLALGSLVPRWRAASPHVRSVVRNFVPVSFGRGVAHVSGFIDSAIASGLGAGAVATLGYAQAIYMLPVSLFGMAVSAAELPAMSSVVGDREAVGNVIRERLARASRRIAFWVVPSAVALVTLGDELASLLYRSGEFGADDARWVWGVLAGSAVGLVASTLGRLYASAFYAMRDTTTPLRFAVLRVLVAGGFGALLAFLGPAALGIAPRWGVAGITAASGIAGWVEFALLRRVLRDRIGPVELATRSLARIWVAAAAAGGVAWFARWANASSPALLRAGLVIGLFGMTYWVITWQAGIPEAVELRRRIFRRRA
jgi:putative peptidoglycan lipid II flippase